MPDALELPRMLRAIVELMRGERLAGFRRSVVDELVALAFRHAAGSGRFARRRPRLMPRFAPVIRALDDLPEPSAGLRGIDAVRINGRSFEVVEFPAREVRSAHVPFITLAVCRKNECAFTRTHEDSNFAHDANSLNMWTSPRRGGFPLRKIGVRFYTNSQIVEC